MKTFFKKIHTESFRWYDEILIVLMLAAAGLEGSILAITVMTITGLTIIIIYRKKKLLPFNPWTEV